MLRRVVQLYATRSVHARPAWISQIRRNATYEPPTPQHSGNPHRNFWKSFGRPIAKVFLGALFTYQIAYWGWSKLEAVEEMHDMDAELRGLEGQLDAVTKKQEVPATR